MKPADQKSASAPRSLKAKGLSTRAALLEAAHEVFEEMGYYSSSVAEIGRRCGVSQGTFYQYFRNKEQAFFEINDLIIDRFWKRAEALPQPGASFEEGLIEVLGLLFEHTRENFFFNRMLGEFELIDPVTIGYYSSIARYYRRFFRQAANEGRIRPLGPNVIAYALIGVAYFHALDWGPETTKHSPPEAVQLTLELILKGICGPKPWSPPPDLAASAFPQATEAQIQWAEASTQGNKTRRSIFQAAELVFGQYGYNRANISEITRAAGVAQGTFYVHFKSKQDLMKGVVEYLSREMRRELRRATDQVEDRRDKEREGMLAFFRFLRFHRQIYRVVAECETIGQEVAMWYYKKLAAGYTASLQEGVAKGEIRDLPVDFLVHSLMGLNHMIGLKWLVWNSSPNAELPRQVLRDAVDLVLNGLMPG